MMMLQEQPRAAKTRKETNYRRRRRTFRQSRSEKTSLPMQLDSRFVVCCIVVMTNTLVVTANSRPSTSHPLHWDYPTSSSSVSSSINRRQQQPEHSMLRQRRYRHESYKSFLLSRLVQLRAGSDNGRNGSNSSNKKRGNNGGDSTDASLSDDDLDEYIEFLLAEADGTVDESANPLFRKEREELQQSWEEDRPIVTPASSTTTIGLDDPISAAAHASATSTASSNAEPFDESEAQQLDEIIESLVDTVGEGETDQDDSVSSSTSTTSLDKDAKVDVLVQKLLDNYEGDDTTIVDGTPAIPKETGDSAGSSTEFFLGPSAVDGSDEIEDGSMESTETIEEESVEATTAINAVEEAIMQPVDEELPLESQHDLESTVTDPQEIIGDANVASITTATPVKEDTSLFRKASRRFWNLLGSKDARSEQDESSPVSSFPDNLEVKQELDDQQAITSPEEAFGMAAEKVEDSSSELDDSMVEATGAEPEFAIYDEHTLIADQEDADVTLGSDPEEIRIGDDEGVVGEPDSAPDTFEPEVLVESTTGEPLQEETAEDNIISASEEVSYSSEDVSHDEQDSAQIDSFEAMDGITEQDEARGDADEESRDSEIALEADYAAAMVDETTSMDSIVDQLDNAEDFKPELLGSDDSATKGIENEVLEVGIPESDLSEAEVVEEEESAVDTVEDSVESLDTTEKKGRTSIFKRIWGRRQDLPETTDDQQEADDESLITPTSTQVVDSNDAIVIDQITELDVATPSDQEELIAEQDETESISDVVEDSESISILVDEEQHEPVGETDVSSPDTGKEAEAIEEETKNEGDAFQQEEVEGEVVQIPDIPNSDQTETEPIVEAVTPFSDEQMQTEGGALQEDTVDYDVVQIPAKMDQTPQAEEGSSRIEQEESVGDELAEVEGSLGVDQATDDNSVGSSLYSDTADRGDTQDSGYDDEEDIAAYDVIPVDGDMLTDVAAHNLGEDLQESPITDIIEAVGSSTESEAASMDDSTVDAIIDELVGDAGEEVSPDSSDEFNFDAEDMEQAALASSITSDSRPTDTEQAGDSVSITSDVGQAAEQGDSEIHDSAKVEAYAYSTIDEDDEEKHVEQEISEPPEVNDADLIDSAPNSGTGADDEVPSDAEVPVESGEHDTTEIEKEPPRSVFTRFWGAPVKSKESSFEQTRVQPDEIVTGEPESDEDSELASSQVEVVHAEGSPTPKRPFGGLFGTLSGLLERKREEGGVEFSEGNLAPDYIADEVVDDIPDEQVITSDVADEIPTVDEVLKPQESLPQLDHSSVFKKYLSGQESGVTESDGGSQHTFVRDLLRKHPSLGSGVEVDSEEVEATKESPIISDSTGEQDLVEGHDASPDESTEPNVEDGKIEMVAEDETELSPIDAESAEVDHIEFSEGIAQDTAMLSNDIRGELEDKILEETSIEGSHDALPTPENGMDTAGEGIQFSLSESEDIEVEAIVGEIDLVEAESISETEMDNLQDEAIADAAQSVSEADLDEISDSLDEEDEGNGELVPDEDGALKAMSIPELETSVHGQTPARDAISPIERDGEDLSAENMEQDKGLEAEESTLEVEKDGTAEGIEAPLEEEEPESVEFVDTESANTADTAILDIGAQDNSEGFTASLDEDEEVQSEEANEDAGIPVLDTEQDSPIEAGEATLDKEEWDEVDESEDDVLDELDEPTTTSVGFDELEEVGADHAEASIQEEPIGIAQESETEEEFDSDVETDDEVNDRDIDSLNVEIEAMTESIESEPKDAADENVEADTIGAEVTAMVEAESEEMTESEASEGEVDNYDELPDMESNEIATEVAVGMGIEKPDQEEAVKDADGDPVEDKTVAPAVQQADDIDLQDDIGIDDTTDDAVTLEDSSEYDQEDIDSVDTTDDAVTFDADSLETASPDDEGHVVDDEIDPITLAASVADVGSEYDEYDREDLDSADEQDFSFDEEELTNQDEGSLPGVGPSILAAADLEYDQEYDREDEEDDVEGRADSIPSPDATASNFVYRFLLARGQEQLVMIFMMICDWCKLYLSPVAELPALITGRDPSSTTPLAFLLPRGGAGSGNKLVGSTLKGLPNEVDANENAVSTPKKSSKKKNKRKKLKDDAQETTGSNDETADGQDVISEETVTPVSVESVASSTNVTMSQDDPAIPRVRPNPLYRFLLGKGYIGHSLIMETVLTFAWVRVYLPDVYRLFNNAVTTILPSLGYRDGEDDYGKSASLATGFVTSDGSTVRAGRKSKTQIKKADEKALDQLKRVGDVKRARYRFVSENFMKRHGIGAYRTEKVDGLDDLTEGRSMRPASTHDEDDDDDESDTEWIEQALIAEDEKPPVDTSIGFSMGSDGPSLSVGVEFGFGEKRKKKRRRKVSDAVRGVSSATKKPRKSVGPRTSDRESGMIGKIRAAGANSLFGRSVLGAYPGDALPPTEAGDARGLEDVATKYGYGEWSEDEYDDDDLTDGEAPRKRQKAKVRRQVKKRSRKKSSSSISVGINLSPNTSDLPPKSAARTRTNTSKKKKKTRDTSNHVKKSPILSSEKSDIGSKTKKDLVKPALGRLDGVQRSSNEEDGNTQRPAPSRTTGKGAQGLGITDTAMSKLKEASEKRRGSKDNED